MQNGAADRKSGALRIAAVTCLKNEGPFLLEWIAHHRVLGVTDFLFWSNDCTDGTDSLLDALAASGVLRHLPNPATEQRQHHALQQMATLPEITAADWIWVADVDEFLNIHTGDGTIPTLIAACGDPQAISVTWQFFANCDIEQFEDRPVTLQFPRSHNPDIWADQLQIGVKTLMRRDFPLHLSGPYRPFTLPGILQSPRWTDGSGRAVPDRFAQSLANIPVRSFTARGARVHATLNHYALRSLDSYLVKAQRGDVNRARRKFDADYWANRNDDAVHDTSIQRYRVATDAEIARLKALPGVAALHDFACSHHAELARQLREVRPWRGLARELRKLPKTPPAELALMALLQ